MNKASCLNQLIILFIVLLVVSIVDCIVYSLHMYAVNVMQREYYVECGVLCTRHGLLQCR